MNGVGMRWAYADVINGTDGRQGRRWSPSYKSSIKHWY